MVRESNQNVLLIQIDASSFTEVEIPEFEIVRVDYFFSWFSRENKKWCFEREYVFTLSSSSGYFWSIFTCYALLHSCGHSHSPPLIHHYMSYRAHVAYSWMHAFDQSCHTSIWASAYIFQACEASIHIFSTLCRWEILKCVSQRIRRERGLNPGPSNPQAK